MRGRYGYGIATIVVVLAVAVTVVALGSGSVSGVNEARSAPTLTRYPDWPLPATAPPTWRAGASIGPGSTGSSVVRTKVPRRTLGATPTVRVTPSVTRAARPPSPPPPPPMPARPVRAGAAPVAVAVANLAAEVRAGDEVGYRIAVINRGTSQLRLAVQAQLPSGLGEVRPASSPGEVLAGGRVLWWVTLPPGAGRELWLTGRYDIGGRPSEVVACVYTDLARPPLACGSHVDAVGQVPLILMLAWLGLGAGAVAMLIGFVHIRRRRRAFS